MVLDELKQFLPLSPDPLEFFDVAIENFLRFYLRFYRLFLRYLRFYLRFYPLILKNLRFYLRFYLHFPLVAAQSTCFRGGLADMEAILFVTRVPLQGELRVFAGLMLLSTLVGGEGLFTSRGSAVDTHR